MKFSEVRFIRELESGNIVQNFINWLLKLKEASCKYWENLARKYFNLYFINSIN